MYFSTNNDFGKILRAGAVSFTLCLLGTLICSSDVFLARVTAEETASGEGEAEAQLRDPMTPANMSIFSEPVRPEKKQAKTGILQLQGVGRSSRGAYAVIDGNVIREGETKGEVKVVKIGETKVDILVNGEAESLPIK